MYYWIFLVGYYLPTLFAMFAFILIPKKADARDMEFPMIFFTESEAMMLAYFPWAVAMSLTFEVDWKKIEAWAGVHHSEMIASVVMK